MILSTTSSFQINSNLSDADLFGTPSHSVSIPLAIALATGTGAGQADLRWVAKARPLAATTSEALDLSGVLTDTFKNTINNARVKLLVIQLITPTAGYTLEAGGAATNAAGSFFGDVTDKVIVRAGGFIILYAPDATAYSVTAATADQLKINNPNAAGITYNALIVGASA